MSERSMSTRVALWILAIGALVLLLKFAGGGLMTTLRRMHGMH
jgi:hypothetical protein